jgi:hypothetical protein
VLQISKTFDIEKYAKQREDEARNKKGDTLQRLNPKNRRKAITEEVKNHEIKELIKAFKEVKSTKGNNEEENNMQNKLIIEVETNNTVESTFRWMEINERISGNLISFGHNAILNTLATADNKKRWGYFKTAKQTICNLCKLDVATITHILAKCNYSLGVMETKENRIKWRHDQILRKMKTVSEVKRKKDVTILYDIDEQEKEIEDAYKLLFNTKLRPDILIIDPTEKRITIGELTSCMEANIEKWMDLKARKYENLHRDLCNWFKSDCYEVEIIPLVISARGILTHSVKQIIKKIVTEQTSKKDIENILKQLSQEAILASKRLYDNRDNKGAWGIGTDRIRGTN